jgi:heme oxygenase
MAVQARRHLLKERSASAHRAVENAIGPWRSGADYRRYLCGMLAFRAPLEAVLDRVAWPRQWQGWRPVSIATELREDSRDLGLGVPAPEQAGDTLPNPAAAIGVAYVLEGSSLGATVLARRASAFGLHDTHGARHLARQRGGIDNWRRFLALLEISDALDMDEAAAAAVSTFEAASAAIARA